MNITGRGRLAEAAEDVEGVVCCIMDDKLIDKDEAGSMDEKQREGYF